MKDDASIFSLFAYKSLRELEHFVFHLPSGFCIFSVFVTWARRGFCASHHKSLAHAPSGASAASVPQREHAPLERMVKANVLTSTCSLIYIYIYIDLSSIINYYRRLVID